MIFALRKGKILRWEGRMFPLIFLLKSGTQSMEKLRLKAIFEIRGWRIL